MKANVRKSSNKILCWGLVFSLIAAVALEFGFFMQEQQVSTSGTIVSLIQGGNGNISTFGYEVQENRYEQVNSDPQIVILDVDCFVRSISIEFAEKISPNVAIQVFYSTEDGNFSEENSVKVKSGLIPAKYVAVDLPGIEAGALRIDIDGSFVLSDITISDEQIVVASSAGGNFNVLQFAVMFVAFSAFFALIAFWFFREQNERCLSNLELLFCGCCFVYYFLWAVAKTYNYAPDEAMRYDVTKFLFDNNRLPVGDELLSAWGFSYAHLPTVLCNQLGYVFMKVASLFTGRDRFLLLSARMVSVCCGAGSIYFLFKSAKQLCSPIGKWILVVFVAAMPQFAFLTSYVNNDIVAFLGITMILYAWVLGMKENWNLSNATLLAIGISICGLAYYNSYAWVLFSIFFFFATYFSKNKKFNKELRKLTAYIVVLVFVLIGYSFIRHIVIYGDLLGFKTSRYYGELYAIDTLKPSNRYTLSEQGVPLLKMLFDPQYAWLNTTWKSFIGAFGYMQYWCPPYIYIMITLFTLIGGAGALLNAVNCVKNKDTNKNKTLFYTSILASALFTVALSTYNSYFTDFQPQGRYCYPAFPSLAVIVAKGYEYWAEKIKKSEYQYAAGATVCTILIAVSLYVYKVVYLPT